MTQPTTETIYLLRRRLDHNPLPAHLHAHVLPDGEAGLRPATRRRNP